MVSSAMVLTRFAGGELGGEVIFSVVMARMKLKEREEVKSECWRCAMAMGQSVKGENLCICARGAGVEGLSDGGGMQRRVGDALSGCGTGGALLVANGTISRSIQPNSPLVTPIAIANPFQEDIQ